MRKRIYFGCLTLTILFSTIAILSENKVEEDNQELVVKHRKPIMIENQRVQLTSVKSKTRSLPAGENPNFRDLKTESGLEQGDFTLCDEYADKGEFQELEYWIETNYNSGEDDSYDEIGIEDLQDLAMSDNLKAMVALGKLKLESSLYTCQRNTDNSVADSETCPKASRVDIRTFNEGVAWLKKAGELGALSAFQTLSSYYLQLATDPSSPEIMVNKKNRKYVIMANVYREIVRKTFPYFFIRMRAPSWEDLSQNMNSELAEEIEKKVNSEYKRIQAVRELNGLSPIEVSLPEEMKEVFEKCYSV